jgi:hypothetical protein
MGVHLEHVAYRSLPAPPVPAGTGLLRRQLVPVRDWVVPALPSLFDGLPGHDWAAVGCAAAVGARVPLLCAELIDAAATAGGWRAIDAESFLYYSPHALAGTASVELGLGGPTATFVDVDPVGSGLRFAELQLRLGHCRAVLLLGLDAEESAPATAPASVQLGAALLTADERRPAVAMPDAPVPVPEFFDRIRALVAA